MRQLSEELVNKIRIISFKYSPDDMPNYWLKDDRYIRDAKRMDNSCVVIKCELEDAKNISSYFVNNLFAGPTCTYYDGEKLSLCCEYAMSNWGKLKEETENYICEYLSYNPFKKK